MLQEILHFARPPFYNGQTTAEKNHDYFYQIQCTMFCTQQKWCDLVVRTQDIHIERITYDNKFWTTVMPKLKLFYFTAVLPELSFPQPYENHQMNLKRSGRTFLNIYRLMHALYYFILH